MARLLSYMAATPLAAPVISLAVGILCGRFISSDIPIYIAILCCLTGAVAVIRSYQIKDTSRRMLLVYAMRNHIWTVVIPAWFVAGFLLLHNTVIPESDIYDFPYARGIVTDRVIAAEGERFRVKVNAFVTDMGVKSSVRPFDILLYTGATDIEAGDEILFRANLRAVPYDSEVAEYMYAQGIDFTSSTPASKIRILDSKKSLFFIASEWRDRMLIELEKSTINPQSKAFICALLLGWRQGLTPEMRDDFTGAGIAHVLAVSGLHVGIIIMLLGWITKPLNLLSQRSVRFIIMCLGIVLFAFLTGLNIPVIRASVMAVCMLFACMLQRKYSVINTLCLAAGIIMIFTPRALFDVGFQLSFACALIVISIVPALSSRTKESRFRDRMITLVSVPVSVFVLTWPLVAYHFHTLSFLFLPLNIVIVPMLPVYMSFLIIYLLMLMCECDIEWLAHFIDFITGIIMKSAHYISQITQARADIFPHWLIAVLGVAVIVLVIYYIKSRSKSSFLMAASASVALCIAALALPSGIPPDKVVIPSNYKLTQVVHFQSGHKYTHNFKEGEFARLSLSHGHIIYADAPPQLHKTACLTADILIIGHNFTGNTDSLMAMCRPRTVVLSARANDRLDTKVRNSVAKSGIPFHSLGNEDFELVYEK